jgi:hypothetical protein
MCVLNIKKDKMLNPHAPSLALSSSAITRIVCGQSWRNTLPSSALTQCVSWSASRSNNAAPSNRVTEERLLPRHPPRRRDHYCQASNWRPRRRQRRILAPPENAVWSPSESPSLVPQDHGCPK